MGGDSARTSADGDQTLRSPKIFERRGLLFGFSGEARIIQLLEHVYDFPVPAEGQNIDQFVIRDFCCGLRAFLLENASELLPSLDDDEEIWQLLVGVRGRVFRICSHLSCSESATGYEAIGSGSPLALGSLASTEGMTAEERVAKALSAAERHNQSVAGPFTVLRIQTE